MDTIEAWICRKHGEYFLASPPYMRRITASNPRQEIRIIQAIQPMCRESLCQRYGNGCFGVLAVGHKTGVLITRNSALFGECPLEDKSILLEKDLIQEI